MATCVAGVGGAEGVTVVGAGVGGTEGVGVVGVGIGVVGVGVGVVGKEEKNIALISSNHWKQEENTEGISML